MVSADFTKIELTLLEKFVDLTDFIWWFVEAHPTVQAGLSAGFILTIWMVFLYHEDVLKDSAFFENNVQIAGRFSRPTYVGWRVVAMTIPPIGLSVLIFCVISRFKTEPFIATFGIKGTSKVKEIIIRKAVKAARAKS